MLILRSLKLSKKNSNSVMQLSPRCNRTIATCQKAFRRKKLKLSSFSNLFKKWRFTYKRPKLPQKTIRSRSEKSKRRIEQLIKCAKK